MALMNRKYVDNLTSEPPKNWKEMGINRNWHDPNGYAIRCGYPYRLYKAPASLGDNTYYIYVKSKTQNTSTTKLIKLLKVVDNEFWITNYRDGTLIRPLRIVEDFYFYKKNKFTPIYYLVFTDWEIIKTQEELEKIESIQAREKYNKDLVVKNLEFSDEELPF